MLAPLTVTVPVAPEACVVIVTGAPWNTCEDGKLMKPLLVAVEVRVMVPDTAFRVPPPLTVMLGALAAMPANP